MALLTVDVEAVRFQMARVPDRLPAEWISPYRLLFGTAYSVGAAESVLTIGSRDIVSLPSDLSSSLKAAVSGAEEYVIPWLHFWKASNMLTSAIY